jgi:adenylate cyclase
MAAVRGRLAARLMRGGLVGLACGLLALALWSPGWLDSWEATTWDARVRLLARPGPATGDIVLVLIDQNSLDWAAQENGLSWPWPREIYSAVIEYCRGGGARSLSLDMLYTEPSVYGAGDDLVFARAAEDMDGLAAALFLGSRSGSNTSWPELVPRPDLHVEGLQDWTSATGVDLEEPRAAFPVRELATAADMLGNVNLAPDPDGVYRRSTLFRIFDGQVVASLPLAGLLAAAPDTRLAMEPGRLRVADVGVPLDADGKALLNYRGPVDSYRTLAAAAVIRGAIQMAQGREPDLSPEVFQDKHVLLGASAPGLYDLRPSPVSGVYPGVAIHATMLDNLLSGDFMRMTPAWGTWILTLALALLAGLAAVSVRKTGQSVLVHFLLLVLPLFLVAAAYGAGAWQPLVVLELGVVLALFGGAVVNYATEGRQKRFIKNAFSQYLSPAVIEHLMSRPELLSLGGERRELSIFFSDLQGFTSISEGLDPEELTALLNEYLTAMTDIILEEGGTVDKYEGDAIIVFWNAPLPQPDHRARAVRAALRCQRELARMRPGVAARIGKELHMRIGLNSGPAVVGNLGSDKRFDYTMLGDAVNLAARLEGINKQFGTFTCVSKSTLEGMSNEFCYRELSRVGVVGRAESTTIYEPMWPEEYEARKDDLDVFAMGLAAFYKGEFDEARMAFGAIRERDPAADRYWKKCRELAADPPEDWDGVWRAKSK